MSIFVLVKVLRGCVYLVLYRGLIFVRHITETHMPKAKKAKAKKAPSAEAVKTESESSREESAALKAAYAAVEAMKETKH